MVALARRELRGSAEGVVRRLLGGWVGLDHSGLGCVRFANGKAHNGSVLFQAAVISMELIDLDSVIY